MRLLSRLARALAAEDAGQGVVEYSLVVGSISLVIALAFVTGGIEGATGNLVADLTSRIQP
jgi:Flp pilus assembly pilin Flp